MGKAVTYTRETIERALEHHTREGRIKSWHVSESGHYVIQSRSRFREAMELRTLREVWIMLFGLMSGAMSDTDQ